MINAALQQFLLTATNKRAIALVSRPEASNREASHPGAVVVSNTWGGPFLRSLCSKDHCIIGNCFGVPCFWRPPHSSQLACLLRWRVPFGWLQRGSAYGSVHNCGAVVVGVLIIRARLFGSVN